MRFMPASYFNCEIMHIQCPGGGLDSLQPHPLGINIASAILAGGGVQHAWQKPTKQSIEWLQCAMPRFWTLSTDQEAAQQAKNSSVVVTGDFIQLQIHVARQVLQFLICCSGASDNAELEVFQFFAELHVGICLPHSSGNLHSLICC